MTYNNRFSSDKNYPGIAYLGRFPACSSVVYVKYTPSSQAGKPSVICDPDVNICF